VLLRAVRLLFIQRHRGVCIRRRERFICDVEDPRVLS